MARLISCSKCGRIHEENKCNAPTAYYGRKMVTRKIRNTTRWQYARRQALERDLYICRMCLDRDNVIRRDGLEVHHITPIYKNANMAYDIDNLITLCKYHHRMVEDNEEYKDYLKNLINKEVTYTI